MKESGAAMLGLLPDGAKICLASITGDHQILKMGREAFGYELGWQDKEGIRWGIAEE